MLHCLKHCWTYLVYTGPTVYPDALKRPGVKRRALHCLFFINVRPVQTDGWEHVEEPRWFTLCLSTSIFIQIRWRGLERGLGVLELWEAVVVLVGFQCFFPVLMCVSNADRNFSVKLKPVLKCFPKICLYQTDLTSTDWHSYWKRKRENVEAQRKEKEKKKTRQFKPLFLSLIYSMLNVAHLF